MPTTTRKSWVVLGLLGLIAVVGLWLRLRCLGCLGFRGDEDLTSLAVKALAATGTPELPSGMIYLRFYLYQWVSAISISLLGFSEYSMRLPAVLFGLLLIPSAYWIASRLSDVRTGLLIAAVIAIAYWQVEISRTARMYAPFVVAYLWAAYAIYVAHFRNIERHWSPFAFLLCLLALSFHQLAYSLAIFYLLAIPLRPTWRRSAALFVQAGGVGAGFLASKSLIEGYFYRGRDLGTADSPMLPEDGGGLIESILGQLALPRLDVLATAAEATPLLLSGFLLLAVSASAWSFRQTGSLPTASRLLGIAAIVAVALQQFNLACILLAVSLVALQRGIGDAVRLPWLWFPTAVATLTVALLALTVLLTAAGDEAGSLRSLGRSLLDYPNYRLFWAFVLERPFLSLGLALGTLWGLNEISRPNPDPVALWATGGFWGVLMLNGMIDTKFEFFRYSLHVDFFYWLLVVVGITRLMDTMTGLRLRKPLGNRQLAPGLLFGITAAVALVGARPELSLINSSRGYTVEPPWDHFGGAKTARLPDFRSPGHYVRDNAGADDTIIVFDPREYWNYAGRVDYWVWSDNYQSQTYFDGVHHRDLYVNVPVLPTLSALEDAIASAAGEIWIMYTGDRLKQTRWVNEDIKTFIATLDEHIVFTGEDEDTVVITLGRDDSYRDP